MSEVFTHDQAQNGPRRGPQAGFDFEKCAATVLNSHENVEACFVIEIAERNILPLPRLGLKTLVNKIQTWPPTEVWGPLAGPRESLHSVSNFEIQRNHVGNLTEIEFGIWTEEQIAVEDGAHLQMHAEQKKFGVESRSNSTSYAPAMRFLFNFILHLVHRWWQRRCILRGRLSGARRLGANTSTLVASRAPV